MPEPALAPPDPALAPPLRRARVSPSARTAAVVVVCFSIHPARRVVFHLPLLGHRRVAERGEGFREVLGSLGRLAPRRDVGSQAGYGAHVRLGEAEGAGGERAGVSDALRVSILRGCFRVEGWRSRGARGVRSYHMTMCSCTLSITSTSSSSVMKSSVLSLRWCGPDISRSETPEPGGAFASLARPRSPPPEKDWVGRRLDAEADEGGPLVERGSSSPVADDAETCEVRAGLLRRLRRVFVRRPACWSARPPASGKRNIPGQVISA